MNATKRGIFFAILCVLALAAGWMLLSRSSLPPRPRCQVTVTTVGITNDAVGARHATFGITNVGRHALMLVPVFAMENYSGQWRTNLVPPKALTIGTNMMGVLAFHPRARRLEPGECCMVTLVLPFDDSGWRASFWYIEVWPPLERAVHDLSMRFRGTNWDNRQLITSTDWTDR